MQPQSLTRAHPLRRLLTTDCFCRLTTCSPLTTNHLTPHAPPAAHYLVLLPDSLLTCPACPADPACSTRPACNHCLQPPDFPAPPAAPGARPVPHPLLTTDCTCRLTAYHSSLITRRSSSAASRCSCARRTRGPSITRTSRRSSSLGATPDVASLELASATARGGQQTSSRHSRRPGRRVERSEVHSSRGRGDTRGTLILSPS